jgi:FSR family fosmidomycin resistance protein-like MFS transporter
MQKAVIDQIAAAPPLPATGSAMATAFPVLIGLSFCHLLNDMMQSLIPSMYPMLKTSLGLDFGQIGLITLAFQLTASLLQPVVGLYTDRRPMPYSLVAGMGFTLIGLVLLSQAASFYSTVAAACMVGLGSSVFHPESSRMARLASGGKHGMAQSLFQVGGNAGQAIGPLLAAFIVLPHGQRSIAWFSAAALLGMVLLGWIGHWYAQQRRGASKARAVRVGPPLSQRRIYASVAVLLALMFSKFFYMASMNTYYTFYLIHHFGADVQHAQTMLFVFLAAVATGTIIGGPVGDRLGRRRVIWGSILGVLPFTLALPYANAFWTPVLSIPIGLILSSAFPAILVYAQELMPGKVGTISGLFFGFAFGLGGLGAATLGQLADHTSVEFVFAVCAFLPAIGLLAVLLPDIEPGLKKKLARA